MRLHLAAIALTLLSSAASAEDETLILERPNDVTEAEWKETLRAFRSSREALAQTLVEAARKLPKPGADPVRALRPRFRVRDAMDLGASRLIDRLVPATASALNDPGVEALVSPRLSGRVVRVGAGGDFASLTEALATVKAGDVIRLAAGDHVVADDEHGRPPTLPWDIWIAGEGADKTSLRIFVNSAYRVRFSGLKLLGTADEIFSLNDTTYLHLKDCVLREFNSRKSEFTAIHMESGLLLVDDCEFNGLDSAEGVEEEDRMGTGGTAIDAAPGSVVVVRRTRFVDCATAMFLDGVGAVDGCVGETTCDSTLHVATRRESRAYFRNCRGLYTEESEGLFPMPCAGSDFDVARAATEGKFADGLLETLAADRNLSYWLGLTRHADKGIREAAAKRWSALTQGIADPPAPKPAPAPEALDQAIAALDAEDAAAREKAAAVLGDAGEAARDRLKAAAAKGSPEGRARATFLLADLDRLASLGGELDFAKRAVLFDEDAPELEWNSERKAYDLKK
ncbi:MAG: hypothetical protein AAB074_20190 [Planctomycetota bacterium]